MCVVSNIGDQYRGAFPERWPNVPFPDTANPVDMGLGVSQRDFDALKREVEELKELLKAAKRFDEETGQPDCEMDEKIAFVRWVADLVGVDLEDVFGDD